MRRADMLAIKAYLFDQDPVARPNRPHDLPWYLRLVDCCGSGNWCAEEGEFVEKGEVDGMEPWCLPDYGTGALLRCHSPRNREPSIPGCTLPAHATAPAGRRYPHA